MPARLSANDLAKMPDLFFFFFLESADSLKLTACLHMLSIGLSQRIGGDTLSDNMP